MNVLVGHAVAHGKNIPYLPMLEAFRSYYGITETDSAQAAREKIAGRLLLTDESLRELLPVVFEFFGVTDPEHPVPRRMDPEAKQRQLFATLRKEVREGEVASQLVTLASNTYTIRESLHDADLVVGAVLIPGAAAPKIVRREMLAGMKPGSVMVDVAIDQGGCFETSRATTHTDPVYYVDDVLHYCVSNMPAAVPHTSTFALTNATMPYLLQLANLGLEKACEQSHALREGVNTYQGAITYAAVAESQHRQWKALTAVM